MPEPITQEAAAPTTAIPGYTHLALGPIRMPVNWDRMVERAGKRNLTEALDLVAQAYVHFDGVRVSPTALEFRELLEHRSGERWQCQDLVHLPPGATAVVISDFHGRLELFDAALKASRFIERLEAGENVYLVINGDTTDRGPEMIKCMEAIFELCLHSTTKDRIVFLRGNHEAFPETQAKYGLRSAFSRHEPYLASDVDGDERLGEIVKWVDSLAPALSTAPPARRAALGLWMHLNKVFGKLPTVAYSSCDIMIGHSCISSTAVEGDLTDALFEVSTAALKNPLKWEMLCAHMGNEPDDTKKHHWISEERATDWRKRFNLSLIVRGHQDSCPAESAEAFNAENGFWWSTDGGILTVFASRDGNGSAAAEIKLVKGTNRTNGVSILQLADGPESPDMSWLDGFLAG